MKYSETWRAFFFAVSGIMLNESIAGGILYMFGTIFSESYSLGSGMKKSITEKQIKNMILHN